MNKNGDAVVLRFGSSRVRTTGSKPVTAEIKSYL